MFNDEFFPTPSNIVYKMLDRVSKQARYFLDPSAGKGDIAKEIRRRGEGHYNRESVNKVDCIEISPDLTAILLEKGFPVVGDDFLNYAGVCYYPSLPKLPETGALH